MFKFSQTNCVESALRLLIMSLLVWISMNHGFSSDDNYNVVIASYNVLDILSGV